MPFAPVTQTAFSRVISEFIDARFAELSASIDARARRALEEDDDAPPARKRKRSGPEVSGVGDYQVAELMYMLVGDTYVLASSPLGDRSPTWYRFCNTDGIWKRDEIGLSIPLTTILGEQFRLYNRELLQEYATTPADNAVRRVVLEKKLEYTSQVQRSLSMFAGKNAVIKEAQNLFYRPNFMSMLDSAMHLFCFSNGVFDLATREFRMSKPEDMVSLCCGHAYLEAYDGSPHTLTPDEKAEMDARLAALNARLGVAGLLAEPWRFLEALPERMRAVAEDITAYFESLFSDRETRGYALMAFSMALSGDTTENQVAHLLHGRGSNGKSVLLETLLPMLFGSYHYPFDVRNWTSSREDPGGTATGLARGRARRLATSCEVDRNTVVREQAVKNYVGGTDPVTCRELFSKTEIIYIPQYSCFLSTNNSIRLENYDHGTTRRLRYLPLTSYFYSKEPLTRPDGSVADFAQHPRDPGLQARMRASWASPLLWLLVRVFVLVNGRLPEPSDSKYSEVYHYTKKLGEENRVTRFLDKFVKPAEGEMIVKATLNNQYREWFREQNGCDPPSDFSSDLHARMDSLTKRDDYNTDNGWLGLKLESR